MWCSCVLCFVGKMWWCVMFECVDCISSEVWRDCVLYLIIVKYNARFIDPFVIVIKKYFSTTCVCVYIYIGSDALSLQDWSRNMFSLICFTHFFNFAHTCQMQIEKTCYKNGTVSKAMYIYIYITIWPKGFLYKDQLKAIYYFRRHIFKEKNYLEDRSSQGKKNVYERII